MSTKILRSTDFDFNKNPDPGAAELIIAGAVLGGWTIVLPYGAAEFLFPAIGEMYVKLSVMPRDERENLDKWLRVVDQLNGRNPEHVLVIEVEAASHEPPDVVHAAVWYVHDGYLRRWLEDLISKAKFMLAFDRRPGIVIGYCMKTLHALREIEPVRIIAPSGIDRVARYTRRVAAAQSIQPIATVSA
ncbi:MAG: hypothetical protein IT450_02230 [Phycisphaerales bacterium]|nr:hypothetical protein [Phycisphaerales bacterium]